MQKENLPLVSVVTLNFNTPEVTSDFLHSIKQQNTYSNLEVNVVDNRSRKDPTSDFKKIYPSATIILNKKNFGFAAGNNEGIKIAKADIVFIVNNDTDLTPGLI